MRALVPPRAAGLELEAPAGMCAWPAVPSPGCHGSGMQLQVSLDEWSPSQMCRLNGSLAVPYRRQGAGKGICAA